MTAEELGQMIWNVKELLRNVYDNKDVEDVILPFTLLRRLDCVLVGSEALVATNMKQLEELGQTSQEDIDNMMPMLMDAAGYKFYNTSGLSLSKLITVPADLTNNFKTYLEGFSPNIREILKNFTGKGENASLSDIFSNLARKNLLLQVTKAFVLNIDLQSRQSRQPHDGYCFRNCHSLRKRICRYRCRSVLYSS
jgi:type I restriction enzyme M protein